MTLLQGKVKALLEMAPLLKEPYLLSKEERMAFVKLSVKAEKEGLEKELLAILPSLFIFQPHHQGFLANVLEFMLRLEDFSHLNAFLKLLPERIVVKELAFNLARLYAHLEEKESLLKAVRTAGDLGMEVDTMLKEPAFDPYRDDPDFTLEINAIASRDDYVEPIYDLTFMGFSPDFYYKGMRRVNLTALGIDFMNTKGVFPEKIGKMHQLEHLSLLNHTPEMPLPIEVLKSLKKLKSISYQPLEWDMPFPKQLLMLNLKQLEIHEYGLKSISTYKNIDALYVHCKDSIKTVNDIVKYSLQIKHLSLIALPNSEIFIPKEVIKLDKLESLSVDGPILGFSKEFRDLGQLKKLRIQTENNFTFLEEITHLKNLEDLAIIGSYFKEVPDSLGQLKKLKKLNLAYSFNAYLFTESKSRGAIKVIPIALPKCFGELENLEELDLSFCAVDSIEAVGKLKKLRKLELIGTKIKI